MGTMCVALFLPYAEISVDRHRMADRDRVAQVIEWPCEDLSRSCVDDHILAVDATDDEQIACSGGHHAATAASRSPLRCID